MVQGTPRTLQLHSKNIYVRMPRKEHLDIQRYCFFEIAKSFSVNMRKIAKCLTRKLEW